MPKTKQKRTGLYVIARILVASAVFLFFAFGLFAGRADSATGINEQLNFQGRLLNNLGAVIADGDYNIEFKIYQDGDGVPGGGDETLKWTETRTGANKVTVKNGYFSANLGSVTAFASNIDWNQDTLWLSVNIGGTGSPSWDGEMNPMKRLSSSPYALNSKYLGGIQATGFVQLAPNAVQTETSTTLASIFVNKNNASGTPNILQLQKASSDVLVLDNGGQLELAIQGSNGGLLIGGDATFYRSAALHLSTNSVINANAFRTNSSNENAINGAVISSVGLTLYGKGAGVGPAVVVKGLSGQSSDLQQWRTNGDVVLGSIGATGATLFRNSTNSTTAFQVQNAAAANLFTVDTSTTSNLVTNGDIEGGVATGWTAKGATTVTQSSSHQWQGNNSLSVATTTAADDGAKYNYTFGASTQYTLSLYAKVASGSITDVNIGRQDNGSDIDCLTGQTVNTNWTRFSCTFTTGGTISGSNIYVKKTGTSAETFFIDGVQLQTGASATAFDPGGKLQLAGLLNSPVAFQNKADSTQAFQIQNSAGTSNLFVADTINNRIGVGATPANGVLTVGTNTTTAAGGLYFGTDTYLYRSGASALVTDASLSINSNLLVTGSYLQSNNSNYLGGTTYFGSAGGGNWDTTLYRGVANGLRTDDQLQLSNSSTTCTAYATGGAESCIWFGPDTNLYRSAANTLKTDDYVSIVSPTCTSSCSPSLAITSAIGGTSGTFKAVDLSFSAKALSDTSGDFRAISVQADLGNNVNYTGSLRGFDLQVSNSRAVTLSNVYGSNVLLSQSTAAGTITTGYGYYSDAQVSIAGGSIGTRYGFAAANPQVTAGSITNNYGLYIANQTAGTNDYGIYIGGADTASLQLGSDAGTAASGIKFGSTGDTNLYRSAADMLKTDDSLLVAGANLGVNTTGPDRRVDILDASNPQLRLTQADGTVYADFQVDSNGDLIQNVDGVSNQLVLDNGGNVGIGTASPGYGLDVSGIQNTARLVYRPSSTVGPVLALESGNSTVGQAASQISRVEFKGTGAAQGRISYGLDSVTATNDYLDFQIGGLSSTDLRIQGDGSVGINTTGPDRKLDVLDASNPQLRLTQADGTVYTDFQTDSGGALQVTSSGGIIQFQAAGSSTISRLQVGAGGAGSTTPDYLALDVKSDTGDPAGGAEGYMYYNTLDNKFRCYENAAWKDCDTNSGTSLTLQGAYDNDANGSDTIIALTADDDSVIIRNPASSGSDSTYILTIDQLNTSGAGCGGGACGGLSIQSAGTGNLLLVTDTTATAKDVFKIADTGITTLQTQTDSATALQVLDNDGGTPVLNVDTDNERVGIGTTTTSMGALLQVGSAEATTVTNPSAAFFGVTGASAPRPYIVVRETAANAEVILGADTNSGTTGIIGTITNHDFTIRTNNTTRWLINTSGHLLPNTDDTYDIGSDAARVRDLYTGPGTIHVGTSTSDEGTITYNTTTNNLALGATNGVLVQNTNNSTTAFQVQNATDSSVLVLDTTALNSNLTNSNFENSSISTWTYSGAAGGSVARSTAQQYLDTASLSITTGTTAAAFDGVKGTIANTLSASTTYYISWYSKITSGTFTDILARFSYDGTVGNQSSCTGINTQTASTSGWTRHACQFTTGSGGTAPTSSNAIFIVQQSDNGGTQRTFFIDAVQVQTTAATPYKETGLALNGVVSSPLSIQNVNNSTVAFQIQNAAGTSNLFVADTLNTRIAIGGTPANGLLTIGANTGTAAGGLYFGTDVNLYRVGNNELKTDDTLYIGGGLVTSGIAQASTLYLNGTTTGGVSTSQPVIQYRNVADGGPSKIKWEMGLDVAQSPNNEDFFIARVKDDQSGVIDFFYLKAYGDPNAPGLAAGFGYIPPPSGHTVSIASAGAWNALNLLTSGGSTGNYLETHISAGGDAVTVLNNKNYLGLGTITPQNILTIGNNVRSNFANPDGNSTFAVEMPIVAAPTGTASDSGGSMTAGTYYYVITALDGAGGETVKGLESAGKIITSSSGSVPLSWTAVAGAKSYKVYRTTVSGTYTTPAYIANPTTNSYTDTAAAASAGAPPSVTTAYNIKLSPNGGGTSWLQGGNFSVGTSAAAAPFHVKVGTDQNLWVDSLSSTLRLTAVNDAASANVPLIIQGGSTISLRPSSSVDIDANSSTSALRLYGATETTEIANIYVGGAGQLILDTIAGSDTDQFIDLRSEDDNYGLVIRESDGTGASTYANFYVVDAATDYINLIVNSAQSTTGLVVNAAGSVGVGSTSPDKKLEIIDSAAAQLRLTQADASVYADFQVDSNGDLIIGVDGATNQLVLDNSGKVGIGTAAPSNRFEIQETDTDTSGVNIQTYNLQTISPSSAPGTTVDYLALRSLAQSGNANVNSFVRLFGQESYALHSQTTTLGSGFGARNQVQNTSTGTISNAYAQNPIIQNTGNGTITNAYNIFVNRPTNSASGTIGSTYGVYIDNQTAALGTQTNTPFGVYQVGTGDLNYFGGSVGLNTTGPDRRLDILDASNPQLRLTHTDGSVYSDLQTTAAGELYINPSSSNVGIGISDPDALLHISKANGGGDVGLVIQNNATTNDETASLLFRTTTSTSDFGRLRVTRVDGNNATISLGNMQNASLRESLVINQNGAATFKNGIDNTSAFQVQNSGAVPVIKIDTTTTNVITNGSFEVNTTGWALLDNATIAQSSTQGFSGTNALLIDTTNANDGAKYAVQLAQKTQYTFSVYAKHGTLSGSLAAVMGYARDGVTETAFVSPSKTVQNLNGYAYNEGWSRFDYTFTTDDVAPAGGAYLFIKQTDPDNESFYIDAALLETTTNNRVSNGSFETDTTGWAALTGDTGGDPTLSRVTTESVLGSASLQTVTNADANEGAKFNVSLNSSTEYTLQVYAKLSSGTFTTMNIGRTENGSTQTNCLTGQTVSTSAWTRYQCTFTTGATTGTNYIYVKQTDATARTFWIDAVLLEAGRVNTYYREGNISLQGVVTSPLVLDGAIVMPTPDANWRILQDTIADTQGGRDNVLKFGYNVNPAQLNDSSAHTQPEVRDQPLFQMAYESRYGGGSENTGIAEWNWDLAKPGTQGPTDARPFGASYTYNGTNETEQSAFAFGFSQPNANVPNGGLYVYGGGDTNANTGNGDSGQGGVRIKAGNRQATSPVAAVNSLDLMQLQRADGSVMMKVRPDYGNIVLSYSNTADINGAGYYGALRITHAPIGLDIGGTVATDVALGARIAAGSEDTNQRFILQTDGKMLWGPGNATQDTNLYRHSSGNILVTDDTFRSAVALQAPLVQTEDVTGASTALSVRSGNSTSSGNTGNLTVATGNATSGNSGDISIDTGTASGTKGKITIGGTNASSVSVGNSKTISMTRTLPTVVNDEVDIGSFAFTNGGGTLWVSVTVPSSGFSISKEYMLALKYDQTTNTWVIAQPLSDTGAYSGNNVDLDVNVNAGTASLRLRRTAGSTAGTAYIVIKHEGVNSDVFTPSTATSSVAAPTTYLSSAVLAQANGTVTIQGGFTQLGATNINTTGTGSTTIGNTSADLAITDGQWNISSAGLGTFGGGVTLTGGALAINTASGITSNQATLIVNASGTVDVQDTLQADSLTIDAGDITFSGTTARNVTSVAQSAGSTNSAALTFKSGNVSGATSASGAVNVQSGDSTTSGNTGAITITSGNATSGNSGNVVIDAGTASGTKGEIQIGQTNASTIKLDNTTLNISTANDTVGIGPTANSTDKLFIQTALVGLKINQTGTANLLTLQKSAGDVLTVSDTGNVDTSGTIQAGSSNVNLTLATGMIDADAITLVSALDGRTGTSSASGLAVYSDGLSLLQGCADGEVLKWIESTDTWDCGTGGGSSTLQQAYDAGAAGDQVIALDATQDSIIIRNPASAGSDSTYTLTVDQLATGAKGGFSIQSAGTGNLLLVTDTTATAKDVFKIADTGVATFQTQTDSATGFQILDADGGTPVFNVDTASERVGIGDASPASALTVGSGDKFQVDSNGLMDVAGATALSNTQYSLVMDEATTNLVVNPSFETNLSSWSAITSETLSTNTSTAAFGTNSMSVVKAGAAANDGVESATISITASQSYYSTVYLRQNAGTADTVILCAVGDVSGETCGSTQTLSTTWRRFGTFKSAGGSDTTFKIRIKSSGSQDLDFLVDGAQLENKSRSTTYADGSLGPGYSWSGTAHASTSSRTSGLKYLDDWNNGLGGSLFITNDGRFNFGNVNNLNSSQSLQGVNFSPFVTYGSDTAGAATAVNFNPQLITSVSDSRLFTFSGWFQPNAALSGTNYGMLNIPQIISTSNNLTGTFVANLARVDLGASYSGTVSNGVGFYAGSPTISGGSLTNYIGVRVDAQTSATNNAGIAIGNASGSGNETNLLIGTTTIPSGSYSIYNSSTYNNYFAGNLGIGDTSPGALLEVGDSTQINTTGNVANFYGEKTDTASGAVIGISNQINANPASNSASQIRAYNMSLLTPASNTANFTDASGLNAVYSELRHRGSGTITQANGARIYGLVFDSSSTCSATCATDAVGIEATATAVFSGSPTGTVTNSRGINVIDVNPGAGPLTLTNQAGISIQTLDGATNNTYLLLGGTSEPAIPTGNYGIYNSSTYDNYFAGKLGIGTDTTPEAQLLELEINTAPTADVAAIIASAAGTTTTAVDGLQLDFATAAIAGARDNAGIRINMTPTGATEATDTVQAIKISNITNPTGVTTGLDIGTGWDNAIVVAGGKVLIGETVEGEPTTYPSLVETAFTVDATTVGTSGYVMTDNIFDDSTTDKDNGAFRAIARQLTTGSSDIRAGEFHVVRDVGAAADYTWALELGVHTDIAQSDVTRAMGILLRSSHTGWLAAGTRAGSAIQIDGEDGWTNAIRYMNTNDIDELFKVNQYGEAAMRDVNGNYVLIGQGLGLDATKKGVKINYDNTNDGGSIQAEHQGTAYKPLFLNALGGNVSIGTTAQYGLVTAAGDVYIGAKADATAHTFGSGCSCLTNSAAGTFGAETAIDGATSSAVFNGKVYVGTTETDNAAVYRYDGGTTWTKVTDTTPGKIIAGDTDNIDAINLAVFDGLLYAGTDTGSGGATGAIYSYNGSTWSLVNATRGTFAGQTGLDFVSDLQNWNGRLYVAVGDITTANSAGVYRYDGSTTFTLINTVGEFDSAESTTALDRIQLISYNGHLIGGGTSGSASNLARVAKYVGGTASTDSWEPLNYTTGGGTFGAETNIDDVTSLGVADGQLYVGVGETNLAAIYVYKGSIDRPGVTAAGDWLRTTATLGRIDSTNDATDVDSVPIMRTYNGRLYAGSNVSGAATNGVGGAVYELTGTDAANTNQWTIVNSARGTFGAQQQVDSVQTILNVNGTMYVGTQESGVGSIYSWSKSLDNSYSLGFVTGTDSRGYLSFVGGEQSQGNANRQGKFTFSNAVALTSGAFDYAEDYPTIDTSLEAGEPVSVDPRHPDHVRRAQPGDTLLGVVSKDPGLRLSSDAQPASGARWVPIALAGRVPVKIIGPVNAGDKLALSDIPGVLKKASSPGEVVGSALENYTSDSVGKVSMYVNPGWHGELKVATVSQDGLLRVKDHSGQDVAVLDNLGNATFAGTVTADTIKAGKIEGLEVLAGRISNLEGATAKEASDDAEVDQTPTGLEQATPDGSKPVEFTAPITAISVSILSELEVKGGLVVSGEAHFNGKSIFANLAIFNGSVSFTSGVEFTDHVTFGKDAGGTAIIKKDHKQVEVKFEKPYQTKPIITANYLFEGEQQEAETKQQMLLEGNYNFLITKVSDEGFTISLNKPASEDISFSWLATQIKDAKVTSSQ